MTTIMGSSITDLQQVLENALSENDPSMFVEERERFIAANPSDPSAQQFSGEKPEETLRQLASLYDRDRNHELLEVASVPSTDFL